MAAAVPHCRVADVEHNRARTLALWREADAAGANVVVFPELGLSGYTVRDLALNTTLLDACEAALLALARDGAALAPLAVIGLPLRISPGTAGPGGLFNVAAVVQGGQVLGVVPKSYLPNYREFEEARWFRPGTEVLPGGHCRIGHGTAPFGTDLLFTGTLPDLLVGVEICEDLWVQSPPGADLASAGATILCNLSGSPFTVGKAELRRKIGRAHV